MIATDILRPKSAKDINGSLSIWYHIMMSTPMASILIFLRVSLIWGVFGFVIGMIFVIAGFLSIYKFNFSAYMDCAENLGNNKLLDQITHLIIKYGKIKQF